MSNLPPLHAAAERGDLEAVRHLLRRPETDVNQAYPIGSRPRLLKTPFFFAACANSVAVAEELLRNGADLNPPSCIPPLHAAARNNCLDIMDFLIKSGTDLNATCRCFQTTWTALHAAVEYFPVAREAVRKLLDAGAEVNAGNMKPLGRAVLNRSYEATKLLLKAGADPRQPDAGGEVLQVAVRSISGPADSPEDDKESFDLVAALITAGNRRWSQLPTPCPRLERALPAVATTSPQDLAELFKRLQPDVKARIRCTLLLLNRTIPEKHLRGKILAAMLTDEGETLPLEEWLPEDPILTLLNNLVI